MSRNYWALATDYDGTLATDGRVDEETWTALDRLRQRDRTLILVTGRELNDLMHVCDRIDWFSWAIAENGAVLYNPAKKTIELLCQPPPIAFVERLRAEGVTPIVVGRAIVATWQPHGAAVQTIIDDMQLPLQMILNKRAVMVLPDNVNKASGLAILCDRISLDPNTIIGAGDAENDADLLRYCGWGVAVANALPSLKQQADWVAPRERGQGLQDLVTWWLDAGEGN